ncbi:hypothetical protein ACFE04_022523 [Oxalis oulophora]
MGYNLPPTRFLDIPEDLQRKILKTVIDQELEISGNLRLRNGETELHMADGRERTHMFFNIGKRLPGYALIREAAISNTPHAAYILAIAEWTLRDNFRGNALMQMIIGQQDSMKTELKKSRTLFKKMVSNITFSKSHEDYQCNLGTKGHWDKMVESLEGEREMDISCTRCQIDVERSFFIRFFDGSLYGKPMKMQGGNLTPSHPFTSSAAKLAFLDSPIGQGFVRRDEKYINNCWIRFSWIRFCVI